MSPISVEIGRRVSSKEGLEVKPIEKTVVPDRPVNEHSTKEDEILTEGDLLVTIFSSEIPQGKIRVNIFDKEKPKDPPLYFKGKGPFYVEVRDEQGTEYILRLERTKDK